MNNLILTLFLLMPYQTRVFLNSSHQMFDSSCGFSSASTVMKEWFNEDVTEEKLIREVLKEVNQKAEAEIYAVSLLTLQELFKNHNYTVKGYNMTFSELSNAVKKYPPIIAHLDTKVGHFVVILDIKDNQVLVSDPSTGVRVWSKRDFMRDFRGNVLLIKKRGEKINEEKLERLKTENYSRLDSLIKLGKVI